MSFRTGSSRNPDNNPITGSRHGQEEVFEGSRYYAIDHQAISLGSRKPHNKPEAIGLVSDYTSDRQKPHSRHRLPVAKRGLRWSRMWWQEAVAIIFLAASNIACFVTLHPYQNRPLPEWPVSITLGALLSIFSIILRTSLAFLLVQGFVQLKWHWFTHRHRALHDFALHDEAMYGPVGALKFLARCRRVIGWQILGCALLVLAILTGPFIQLVVRYESCLWPLHPLNADPTGARIPRNNVILGSGHHEEAIVNSLTIAEQAAIRAGINSPIDVGVSCETADCIFPLYTTMGLCAQCEDISNLVEIKRLNNASNIVMSSTIPDGPSVLYNNTDDNVNSQQARQFAAYGFQSNKFNSIVLIGLAGTPFDPVTGLSPLGCDDAASNQTWRCRGYGAAGCNFVPCARTYHAKVANASFTETIIAVETAAFASVEGRWFDGTHIYGALNKTCLRPSQQAALRGLGYNLDNAGDWIPYHLGTPSSTLSDPSLPTTLDVSIVQGECMYATSLYLMRGIDLSMGRSFAGNLTGDENFYDTAINGYQGSELLQSAYNYGNFSFERIESLFDNISLSLTNELRFASGAEEPYNATISGQLVNGTIVYGYNTFHTISDVNNPIYGQAYVTKTCVRVTWAWLILPVVLSTLTLVFFTAALLVSRNLPYDVKSWKTSSLPLLFFGPFSVRDTDVFGSHAHSQQIDELDDVAKTVRMEFEVDDEGISSMKRVRGP